MIRTANLEAPVWNRREIKRYARIQGASEEYDILIDTCIAESEPVLSYRVCYSILPVRYENDALYLGDIAADSQTLQKAIRDAEEVRSMWYEKPMVAAEAEILNPAFDCTPRNFVTGYITEKGILAPPFTKEMFE